MRAKLLKIDSQGYATVIPAGELDSDEVDCLKFSERDQCPLDPSQMVCMDDDNWRHHRQNGYAPLTPQSRKGSSKSASNQDDASDEIEGENDLPSPRSTTPQDYEVPMNILQQSSNQSSPMVSPKLTRQRAVSSTSNSEAETKRLSCVSSKSAGDDVHKEERSEKSNAESEAVPGEEVFDVDSGLEASVDSQQNILQSSNNSKDSSEPDSEPLARNESSTSLNTARPKSMVVFPAVPAAAVVSHNLAGEVESYGVPQVRVRSETVSFPERQSSMPVLSLQPKTLHISLDQNRQVIV